MQGGGDTAAVTECIPGWRRGTRRRRRRRELENENPQGDETDEGELLRLQSEVLVQTAAAPSCPPNAGLTIK